MTNVTKKPRQSRRVAMRFASRMKGRKNFCQWRYRGRTMRKKILSYATQSKKVKKTGKPNCLFCSCECKKLNQSRKRYQNRRQSQRRRQNQKRR
uniref:Uncharacterized protein n=1 Tax=Capra hircus TaxID=9925 RepID=A0A452DLH2_CAPHI